MSPIAHSGIALLGWQCTSGKNNINSLLLFVACANFPDIDFLLYFIVGPEALSLHQKFTHNILFVSLVLLVLFTFKNFTNITKIGLSLVAFSHLFVDLITKDMAVPVGFRLFFPFSSKLYGFGIFPNLYKESIVQVFSFHNLAVLGLETLLFMVPVLIIYRKDFVNSIAQKAFWRPNANC